MDNGINEDLNNHLYDKSLSLDMSQKESQNNKILQEIKDTSSVKNFNETELERLCEVSGVVFPNKNQQS